jgi:corrinoid protein of di/trimethylamine methyltransferase
MSENNTILAQLGSALFELDEEEVLRLTKMAMEEGLNPLDILEKGLAEGIRRIGDSFASGDLTLPHMIIGADIMQRALGILEPVLVGSQAERSFKAKVVIGTVEGDIHDIGKKIVTTLLRAHGYDVVDLGRDVPNAHFAQQVVSERPEFVCMSALMTTTVTNQEEVIRLLDQAGVRGKVRVLVGGAAVMEEMAKRVGADGYAETASEGVALMDQMLGG